MAKSNATRQREYRERTPWTERADAPQHKPFIGVDGEGSGKDSLGRQNYMLMCAGDMELYSGMPLSTLECLEFICSLPSNDACILVGFSFGYDTTMILKDLPGERRERLFRPRVDGQGYSRYVYFHDFAVEYLPKNYLRVARTKKVIRNDQIIRQVIEGTSRTIYEVFGFYQKSFLNVLKQFSIGQEHLDLIERNKSARASFDVMTDEVREYCKTECMLLAELMEKFRENCYAADIRPRQWSGAGKLAGALHGREKTFTRAQASSVIDPGLMNFAAEAYYGGRFEITRTGMICEAVHEYDIRSAYPAAMLDLPCLEHGTWREVGAAELRSLHKSEELFIGSVHFKLKSGLNSKEPGRVGGLPIRSKDGFIYWPMEGNGVYWSPEIRSAAWLGFDINYRRGYAYTKVCNCKPFEWVEGLYEYRRTIGSVGPGYPIKLGINALYGLLAQRVGNGKYANMVWAGLITSLTRSKLNEVAKISPGKICMMATDAIYSTEKLDLDIGEKLGQWEHVELPYMFIVQPGLYWSKKKHKVRGLPLKYFEEPGRSQHFEKIWTNFREEALSALRPGLQSPIILSVKVPVTNFIGLKLAQSRGKPDTAGQWVENEREISFDWSNKRSAGNYEWSGDCVITAPRAGGPKCVSLPHRDFVKSGKPSELAQMRLEWEDQPDYIDLSPPWRD